MRISIPNRLTKTSLNGQLLGIHIFTLYKDKDEKVSLNFNGKPKIQYLKSLLFYLWDNYSIDIIMNKVNIEDKSLLYSIEYLGALYQSKKKLDATTKGV